MRYFAGCVVLGSLLLCGCDSNKEASNTQANAPINQSFDLTEGQSEEEVRQLLGKPEGVITITNKIVLMYNGNLLEFIDGKLTTSVTNVRPHQTAASAESPQKEAPQSKLAKTIKWVKSKTKTATQSIPTPFSPKEVFVQDQNGNPVDHSRLLTKGKVTVVDFYATWCGPCKKMDPVLRKIVSDHNGVVLKKVDIGRWGSDTATRYNVNSVPNVRVFDSEGRLVAPPTSDPSQIVRYIERAQKRK